MFRRIKHLIENIYRFSWTISLHCFQVGVATNTKGSVSSASALFKFYCVQSTRTCYRTVCDQMIPPEIQIKLKMTKEAYSEQRFTNRKSGSIHSPWSTTRTTPDLTLPSPFSISNMPLRNTRHSGILMLTSSCPSSLPPRPFVLASLLSVRRCRRG